MKKILALLLAALMVFSLAACGDEADSKDGEDTGNVQPQVDHYLFTGHDTTLTDVGTPAKTLDPQTVYDNLTYVPQMFYGYYRLRGGDPARETYATGCTYTTRTVEGEEVKLSTLPIGIKAGKYSLSHAITDVKEHNWAEVYYMEEIGSKEDGNLDYVLNFFKCAYEVKGNKLVLTPLKTYEFVQETNTIRYSLSDTGWEYEFSFRGRELTLKSGDQSITLSSGLEPYGMHDDFTTEGYLSKGSKKIDNMYCLSVTDLDDKDHLSIDLDDEKFSSLSIASFESNGLATITIVQEDGENTRQDTYQFVYFNCGEDGWVLTDGTDTYFYNLNSDDYHYGEVSKYLSEELSEQLENMDQSQLEAIVEKSYNLLDDLSTAYEEAGLNVNVNRENGEIALDTTVLFGVNESEISDEGKAFLQKFMHVYTSVVFGEEYSNFVSQIMVEGHTDTNGEYDYNMTLSQARADSVLSYCLSPECGVDAAYATALPTMLLAKGYAYDKPIYDDAGEVDMDASRRVSFRFIINLES